MALTVTLKPLGRARARQSDLIEANGRMLGQRQWVLFTDFAGHTGWWAVIERPADYTVKLVSVWGRRRRRLHYKLHEVTYATV